MSDQDEAAEKSHEPSERKLQKAREKGEIPRSTDLLTTMVYLAMLIFGFAMGGQSLLSFSDALLPLVEQPDRLDHLFFKDGAQAIVAQLVRSALVDVLPVFLLPMALVILTLFATRGIVFAPSKLVPKLNRISPIEGIKNKFGRKGLFEFFKSFAKMLIYSVLLALFIGGALNEIVGTAHAMPAEGFVMILQKMMIFLGIVVLISAAIGVLDFFFQQAEHVRKNRMTHKEMRDEHKDSEGDPYMKQQRRARGEAIAMNQMMGDVPKADVVIVNPTHFAVALKWSRKPGTAPTVVAKGTDAVAARIREVAAEHAVPIHSDPPCARALHATTRIGDQIAPEFYEPVAAAIRFAEAMRKRARERGWG